MKNFNKIRYIILIAIALLTIQIAFASSNSITGGGSSLIYPVFSQWSATYRNKKNIIINYQSIGSGAGLSQLHAKTLLFACSDEPLKPSIVKADKYYQMPMIISGIVPVVNIRNIKTNQLTLSGKTLANIYLGKIKYWNNLSIKKLNPNINLPHNRIILIRRSDGSGTTFTFTNYLSKVSSIWKNKIGFHTTIDWPSMSIGGKGNTGVANLVQITPNSIGYVGDMYLQGTNLTSVKMVNKYGTIVMVDHKNISSAIKNTKWRSQNNFYELLTNKNGKNSWPIVATTYLLFHKKDLSSKQGIQLKDFITWAYKTGGKTARSLGYFAINKTTYNKVLKMLK